jgi:hypothetical protein
MSNDSGGPDPVLVIILLVGVVMIYGGAQATGQFSDNSNESPDNVKSDIITDGENTFIIDESDNISLAIEEVPYNGYLVINSGTYDGEIKIDKDITIVGRNGVKLEGDGHRDFGIKFIGDTDAEVRNIMIDGFREGVAANGTTGDWMIDNFTITDTTFGISAHSSEGDWTVKNSNIRDNLHGVFTISSEGEWEVDNTEISDNKYGVYSHKSTGDWLIGFSTISNNKYGISASSTYGEWKVSNTDIKDNSETGVYAMDTSGSPELMNIYWGSSGGPTRGQVVTDTTGHILPCHESCN